MGGKWRETQGVTSLGVLAALLADTVEGWQLPPRLYFCDTRCLYVSFRCSLRGARKGMHDEKRCRRVEKSRREEGGMRTRRKGGTTRLGTVNR